MIYQRRFNLYGTVCHDGPPLATYTVVSCCNAVEIGSARAQVPLRYANEARCYRLHVFSPISAVRWTVDNFFCAVFTTPRRNECKSSGALNTSKMQTLWFGSCHGRLIGDGYTAAMRLRLVEGTESVALSDFTIPVTLSWRK